MMKPQDLTLQRLRAEFIYDPETGEFRRRRFPWGPSDHVPAGYVRPDGYVSIEIGHRPYLAHVLAWFYVNGEWPSTSLDHKNGTRDDNRIANLRPATQTQNNGNSKLSGSNTSGAKGVTWDKWSGRWMAQISFAGRRRNLGRYRTVEAAHAAYADAARKLFGEFARPEKRP